MSPELVWHFSIMSPELVMSPGLVVLCPRNSQCPRNSHSIMSPELALPKTRSGKIMRRILRKIAENDEGNLGDTSTLADPGVVADLVRNRPAN